MSSSISFLVICLLLCVIIIKCAEDGDVFYFAYGSDMHQSRVVDKVGRVANVGFAVLNNWGFRFSKFGTDGTGKANIVEEKDASVYGVVYRCSRRQLDTLDQFEGVPDFAGRESVSVTLKATGQTVEAIAYKATKRMTINPGLPPSTAYLTDMLQGAKEHSFPSEFGVHLQALLNQLGYVPEDQKNHHKEL